MAFDNQNARKNARIVIVGAGTFGLSTAWHLARAGYTDITVFDKHSVPSEESEGYDLSKVVRVESESPFYSRLAHESLEAWQTLEPFASAQVFHNSGWLFTLHNREGNRAHKTTSIENAMRNTRLRGGLASAGLQPLADVDAIRAWCPLLTGEMRGWYGMRNTTVGWVEAKRTMEVAAGDAQRLGVKFISGHAGTVTRLVRASLCVDKSTGAVKGVETADGQVHLADKVLLALGIYSMGMLDFEGQLKETSYMRCHLQLTPEETELYAGLPVIHTLEQGYYFPPNTSGIMQTCSGLFAGGDALADISTSSRTDLEVPFQQDPTPESRGRTDKEQEAVEALRESLPDLANRPMVYSKLCYDNNTFDGSYIIASHPSSPASLFVATGGSGHAWKNFPLLGKYVLQCIEGTLPDEYHKSWRWRPDLAPRLSNERHHQGWAWQTIQERHVTSS